MSAVTTFDPIKFKATTRAQWENAADAWHRWGPFLGEWLGPATERMLDLAGVRTASRGRSRWVLTVFLPRLWSARGFAT